MWAVYGHRNAPHVVRLAEERRLGPGLPGGDLGDCSLDKGQAPLFERTDAHARSPARSPVKAFSVVRMRIVTSHVRLELPDEAKVCSAPRDEEAITTRDYLAESIRDDGVRYRSIVAHDELVGEIFLHDIGAERPDSALIGYALFEPRFRGRGFGSEALRLLVSDVARGSELNELIVITAADNVPSRRIAEKNGFVESGGAREDPAAVCYLWRR